MTIERPHQAGKPLATTGAAQPTNSVKPLIAREDRERLATQAVSDLVDLLPPQDFPHPEKFMAAVIATITNYHQGVICDAAMAIAQSTNRLTLKAVTDVCDQMQDRVSRAIERERHLALAAPQKPDQATRNAQLVDYETRIKPLLMGAVKPVPKADAREEQGDGKHASRIAADLESRRARNQVASDGSTGPPQDQSAA